MQIFCKQKETNFRTLNEHPLELISTCQRLLHGFAASFQLMNCHFHVEDEKQGEKNFLIVTDYKTI